MEKNYFNDFTFLLAIFGFLALFLGFTGFWALSVYKKRGDKSFLRPSIITLILFVAAISGGSIMCNLVLTNSKALDLALESNNTVRSLVEEGKKRSALDAVQEVEKQKAVPTAVIRSAVATVETATTVATHSAVVTPTIEEGKSQSTLDVVEQMENHSVTLKRPYLILGYVSENDKLVLIQSSEGLRIGNAFEEAKTIVVAYPYEIDHQRYQMYTNGAAGSVVTETRYAVSIYFYDVEIRELIFYKKLLGAEFPENAKSYNGRVHLKDIIDAVHSVN